MTRSRTIVATAVAVVLTVAAGCSGDDDTPDAGSSAVPTSTIEVAPSSTSLMREVPTVPSSTLLGQSEPEADGVIVAAPTIAPAPPPEAGADPDVATAPPSTEIIGDPQPSPEVTSPPLPTLPPDAPGPPPPCERLAAFDAAGEVEAETGAAASSTDIDPEGCRISSGAVTVEVFFVERSTVESDWFQRQGIEPVGQVSGDAVGFSTFSTPDGRSGDGYTIAVTGGRDGVVVAVSGPDAGLVAAAVAQGARQAG